MTALVTGAGGAIGAAIVAQLRREGHEVIAQDLARLEQFSGPGVSTVQGDLRDPACLAAVRTAPGFSDLDRVIAAHGVEGSGGLLDRDEASILRIVDINAGTIPTLLEAVEDALAVTRGTFVVINSQAGLVAEKDNLAYCASKFAIQGWARAMRPRLRERGISLRLICPGCTATPILFDAMEKFAAAEGVSTEDFTDRRRSRIPVGQFASSAETAASVCFLAEPGSPRPDILAATGGEVLW